MKGKPRPSDEVTCFLNVDLDVEAPSDLTPLVKALGPKVFDLHTGPGRAGYETHLELDSRPGQFESAEATIAGFLELLAALPSRPRALWNKATRRDFNIGIQAGSRPRAFELALSPDSLKAVARVGARVVVTVYGADATSRSLPQRRRRR